MYRYNPDLLHIISCHFKRDNIFFGTDDFYVFFGPISLAIVSSIMLNGSDKCFWVVLDMQEKLSTFHWLCWPCVFPVWCLCCFVLRQGLST